VEVGGLGVVVVVSLTLSGIGVVVLGLSVADSVEIGL